MERSVYEMGIIENTFHDGRDLKLVVTLGSEFGENFTGSLFESSDGEFVYLDYQYSDFTHEDLVRYTEVAESLFAVNHKEVTVYILCFDNVVSFIK